MNTKIVSIVIGILLIGGLGIFIFNRQGENGSAPPVYGPAVSASSSYFTPVSEGSGADSQNPAASTPEQRNSSAGNPVVPGRTDLVKFYSDSKLGISFNYPDGLNVSGFAEGDSGYTILAQKAGVREGFQIFVSDFDEPGPLTAERIKQDLPDMKIESPALALIGADKKISALIFFSESESLGRTREVWFLRGEKLYQLMTYADMDSFVGPVLETLTFK